MGQSLGGGRWRPWDSPGSYEGPLQSLILSEPTFQTMLFKTVPVPFPKSHPSGDTDHTTAQALGSLQQTPVL